MTFAAVQWRYYEADLQLCQSTGHQDSLAYGSFRQLPLPVHESRMLQALRIAVCIPLLCHLHAGCHQMDADIVRC